MNKKKIEKKRNINNRQLCEDKDLNFPETNGKTTGIFLIFQNFSFIA